LMLSARRSRTSGVLDAGRRQVLAELARELAEGAAFDRAQGRRLRPGCSRREADDIFALRRFGWRCRSRGASVPPPQSGEPREVAADAETAITPKHPLAVEHRQARQLDRETFDAVIDRPEHGEPAPG